VRRDVWWGAVAQRWDVRTPVCGARPRFVERQPVRDLGLRDDLDLTAQRRPRLIRLIDRLKMMMGLVMRRPMIAPGASRVGTEHLIEWHAAQVGRGVDKAVARCVALIGSAVQQARARAARRRQSGRAGMGAGPEGGAEGDIQFHLAV
jgi:hypothetical protein